MRDQTYPSHPNLTVAAEIATRSALRPVDLTARPAMIMTRPAAVRRGQLTRAGQKYATPPLELSFNIARNFAQISNRYCLSEIIGWRVAHAQALIFRCGQLPDEIRRRRYPTEEEAAPVSAVQSRVEGPGPQQDPPHRNAEIHRPQDGFMGESAAWRRRRDGRPHLAVEAM